MTPRIVRRPGIYLYTIRHICFVFLCPRLNFPTIAQSDQKPSPIRTFRHGFTLPTVSRRVEA